jgi:hypothetical protein
MILAAVAFVVVVWCVLIVGWMLVLHRMAQSGIQSWDELEREDVELRPYV